MPNKIPVRKAGLISCLLIINLVVLAQDDTIFAEIDTTISSDSLPESVTGSNSFLKRSDTLRIHIRSVPASVRNKTANESDFWYANTDLKKTKEEIEEERQRGTTGNKGNDEAAIREKRQRTPVMLQPWFQNLLWIIIIAGFAVFLVIYLGNSNVGLFRKKIARASSPEEELATEDIFGINYDKEINKAVVSGNLRLAVRLHYLRLLKKMADLDKIHYTQDKTNFDYLVELQPTVYYNQFFRATRNYEYSWYGQFPVSEAAYRVIKNDFDELDQQLNRR
jgi:hypothetical protein